MKYIYSFLFIFSTCFLYGQDKVAKKPEYVIVINDKIVTKEQVDEYGKQGYIKAINKGVADDERARLFKKLGNKIGDKEFIVVVSLFTEKGKMENQKTTVVVKDNTTNDDGYILRVSDSAKDFTVKLVNGKNIKLSDLKGKVILLNFWATWCAPCLMEFYDIPTKIIIPFKNDNFVFLAISIGEREEKVLQKMAKLKKDGIDFSVGIDQNETIWKQYANKSIPKNFLIDQNGIIQYVSTGNAEGNLDKLATVISRLLNK